MGAMGTEVVGVVNLAAIVALAAFLWRVYGKRLDAIDARLVNVDRSFEKMEAKFDGSFAGVDEKFEKMESKFNRRFDKVDGRLGAIDVSVGKLEAQFDGLRGRFDTLEGKVDGLAKDHQRLTNELSEFRGEMRGRLGTFVPQDPGVE